MDRCESCRFVYDEVALPETIDRLRSLPPVYAARLRAAEAAGLARRRPEPTTWSALEYTCHVRDVLEVQHERLELARTSHRPTFAPMGREERVVRDRYNEQDVEVVLGGLADAAARFVEALEEMTPPEWERTGIYNWPEPAERTLAWLARHTLHEGIHHLADVEDVTARVRDRGA